MTGIGARAWDLEELLTGKHKRKDGGVVGRVTVLEWRMNIQMKDASTNTDAFLGNMFPPLTPSFRIGSVDRP